MNKKPIAVVVSESASKNLGDRAIAQALNDILSPFYCVKFLPFSTVPSHRKDVRHFNSSNLHFLSQKFSKFIPPIIKARIRWYLLGERVRYKKKCLEEIRGADFVVVGGGQLVKNNLSLFCDRLLVLDQILKRLDIPSVLLGIGVDSKMNDLTWWLVDGILSRSKFLFFRDSESLKRTLNRVPANGKCFVSPDLAFSLKNSYLPLEGVRKSGSFAINVMHINSMIAGKSDNASIDRDKVLEGYFRIYDVLSKDSIDFFLFTSGSDEDYQECIIIQSFIYLKTGVKLAIFHPQSLDELLRFLVSIERVVATRMHVGILSYISKCNPICINWDQKVEGVWSVVAQEDRIIDLRDFVDDEVGSLVKEKMRRVSPPSTALVVESSKMVRDKVLNQIGTMSL